MENSGGKFVFKDGREFRNQTLSFQLGTFIEALHVQSSYLELNAFDSLNHFGEIFIVSILLGSLTIGSYFKFPLYAHMYDSYKEITNKPIDFLILFQAAVQHVVCVMMTAYYTIGLIFNLTYSEIFGEAWCNIPWYACGFSIAYHNFGSFGVAILRLFYIKFPYQVKDNVRRMKLMFAILISCIAITTLVAIAFGIGNGPASRKQVIWNFCTGTPEALREVVHNYSLLTGTTTAQYEFGPKLIIVIALAAAVGEFICYLLFFHHLYHHNERMRKVLRVGEVKKRHRRNAITFLAQFYGFVVECAINAGFIYTIRESSDISFRLMLVICISAEFGLLSVVEVLTSDGLRRNLPHNRFSCYKSNN